MFVELLLIASLLLGYFVYTVFKKYSFWETHDVPHVKPTIPFGNIKEYVKGNRHLILIMADIYNELKSKYPFCGIYVFFQSYAMVTDLKLLRSICNTDFQSFHDRSIYHNEVDDPLSANLVALQGEKWITLRNKFSPIFTSAKIKQMFPTMMNVCDQLTACIEDDISISPTVNLSEWIPKFTTDVIGSCVFGIECNSLKNPDAKFRQMGKKIFEGNSMTLRMSMLTPFQELARKLHIRVISKEVADFFLGIVKESFEYRENNNVERPDLINILMNLRKSDNSETSLQNMLTLNEISAQAFIFFTAGFETTSNTICLFLYEMALNQGIQERARQCILDTLKKHKDELTHNCVSEMTYFDQCINECLRKYPAVPLTSRKVTKDYRVPGTKYVFNKDFGVLINVYAIHHDPEYYPNPSVFDPDRFSNEQCAKRPSFSYLPFGSGPRFCIGYTFAMLELKLALVSLLRKFRFHPTTREPIRFSNTSLILSPANGVHLRVEELHKS